MPSLANDDDVRQTNEAVAVGEGQYFLKIPDSKTPWRLLDPDYEEFASHWIDMPEGRRGHICSKGVTKLENDGYCPICDSIDSLFLEAKQLEDDGYAKSAKELKEKAAQMNARAQIVFKAVRGQYILEKVGKTKVRVADFDTEEDDTQVAIGVLSLSRSQWNGLMHLVKDDSNSIESPMDLMDYTLITRKEKGGRGKFATVQWEAEAEPSELPDIEIPDEIQKLDLATLKEFDIDELEKVAQYVDSSVPLDGEDEEEVDLESDSEEEISDDFLNDVEDDVDESDEEDEAEEEEEEEEEEDDSEEDDDGFEDDIPEVTPSKTKKSTVRKSTPPAAHKAETSRKAAPVTRSSGSSKRTTPGVTRSKPSGSSTAKTKKKSGKERL